MSISYHDIVYEIIRQMRLVAEIGVIMKESVEEADEHDAEFEGNIYIYIYIYIYKEFTKLNVLHGSCNVALCWSSHSPSIQSSSL